MKFYNPFKPHIWQSKKTGLFYIRVFNFWIGREYLMEYVNGFPPQTKYSWLLNADFDFDGGLGYIKQKCSYTLKEEALESLSRYQEYVLSKKNKNTL